MSALLGVHIAVYTQGLWQPDVIRRRFDTAMQPCARQLGLVLLDHSGAPAEKLAEAAEVLMRHQLQPQGYFESMVLRQFAASAACVLRAVPNAMTADTGASGHDQGSPGVGSAVIACRSSSTACPQTFSAGTAAAPVASALGKLSELPVGLHITQRSGGNSSLQFTYHTAKELGLLLAAVVNSNGAGTPSPSTPSRIMVQACAEVREHPVFQVQRAYTPDCGPSMW